MQLNKKHTHTISKNICTVVW